MNKFFQSFTTTKPSRPFFERPFLMGLLLFLAIGITFFPCLQADFIIWDDEQHIFANPAIQHLSWAGTGLIFYQSVNATYIPLTTLSFALENYFFGLSPAVVHLNNMILHALVSSLLMLLAVRIGISPQGAFWGALIFAIHPMRVETVAWATERKDVLYALFYIAALHSWWSYLETKKRCFWIVALVLAFLSILAKAMALSLPLVILILTWYKKGLSGSIKKFPRVIPFFLIAGGIAVVTLFQNARHSFQGLPDSLIIWTWTLGFYLWKFFFPVDLQPVYMLPEPVNFFFLPYFLNVLFVSGVFIFLWYQRHDRLLILAGLWFYASIFFLLRFDAGDAHVVADRFMYLPSAGITFVLGAYIARIMASSWNRLAKAVIAVVFLLLGFLTWQQCGVWKDGIVFWSTVIKQHPQLALAYNNRAITYASRENWPAAFQDICRAVILDPRPSYKENKSKMKAFIDGNLRYED